MTTIGDIIYASTRESGDAARLGAGTTGQILQSNTGAAPSWSTAAIRALLLAYLMYASGANTIGTEQFITARKAARAFQHPVRLAYHPSHPDLVSRVFLG